MPFLDYRILGDLEGTCSSLRGPRVHWANDETVRRLAGGLHGRKPVASTVRQKYLKYLTELLLCSGGAWRTERLETY
jgi:hypothetical protein